MKHFLSLVTIGICALPVILLSQRFDSSYFFRQQFAAGTPEQFHFSRIPAATGTEDWKHSSTRLFTDRNDNSGLFGASPYFFLYSDTLSDEKINTSRLWIVGGSLAAANVGIMAYYFTTYYSKKESERNTWHVFNDWYNSDMNMDKFGHMWVTQAYAHSMYPLFRWTNMSEQSSIFLSAGLGWLFEFEMENTDAMYKKWGFSLGDVAANTVGALWYIAQNSYAPLQSLNLKWSYLPSPSYRKGWLNYPLKDYEGMTFWLAVTLYDFLPESIQQYYPSWLGIAVGRSITNAVIGKELFKTNNGKGAGDEEWYIAFDYDLRKLPGDTPFLRFLKEELNLIHFPAPTIRITPSVIYYGLYF